MDGPTQEDGTPKVLQEFWKESSSLTDQHVLDYIKHLNTQGDSRQPNDDIHHSTWESPPNPLCAASFGDSGMTATVNAYGLLMQFGDYLGIGRSGLFTADHDCVDEPYWVDNRAEDIDDMTRAASFRNETYGLSLSGLSMKPEQSPSLNWKQWRWPSYRYDPSQFYDSSSRLTVDWMVHEKTLLHRCVLETSTNEDSEIAIRFLKHLRIRDLDHMGGGTYGTGFNDKRKTRLESGAGPGRCTWIWRAPYTTEAEQEASEKKDLKQEKTTEVGAKEPAEQPLSKDSDDGPPDTRRQPTEIRLGYFQHEGLQPPKISVTEPTEKQDLNALVEGNGATTGRITNEPHVLVVVAAVFVNGVPKQFQAEQDWSSPQIWTEKLPKVAHDATNATRRLEIVTAYRMLLRPLSDVKWQDLVIKSEDIDMDCFTKRNPLLPEYLPSIGGHIEVPSTSSTDMKYESNLDKVQDETKGSNHPSEEQAPGVTMSPSKVKNLTGIPQSDSSPSDHIEYIVWRNLEHILSVCSVPVGSKRDDGIQPIALTCGDMSMHRICTSASFFAIQFLIEVSKRLKESNDKSRSVENLQERIRKVCVGHIYWLVSTDKLKSGDFAANYWVNGKVYPDRTHAWSWQAPDGVVNTPFQILKAAEVSSFYTGDEAAQSLCESLLRHMRDPWLERLHEMDQRIKFAWPHAVEEDINIFRLDDHVWIWKALKALHDLKLLEGWSHSSEKRKSSVTDMQRETLQRFTMKNDDSGKRMFAVTRSAREHRFLFHARDTALFYGFEFFQQSTSSRELWTNTIQAQAQHEDNQEMTWDNAIRYALTIVMGLHDSRVNSSKSASEHVQGAVHSLLGITSPNGLFPGQLKETTGGKPMPALFDGEAYRDFYFHAHFEISCVLLLNLDAIFRQCIQKIPDPKENSTQQDLSPKELSRLGRNVESQLEKISSDLANLTEKISVQQEHNTGNEKSDRKSGIAMKKIFPFGSSIDSSKIVEIDEEWLFNYPAFLEKQQSPLPEFTEIGTRQAFRDSKPTRWFVSIMDVPKQKHVGKMRNKQRQLIPSGLEDKADLWNTLRKQRKAEDAKKRLIWLRHPDTETAILCYLATPDAYKAPLSLFFERYSKQQIHFSDEASKVHNEWKTELLFSFYVLSGNVTPAYQQVVHPSSSAKSLPTVQGSTPMQCCIGFRFEGDIFDRYWTCYFIDSSDGQSALELEDDLEWSTAADVGFWRQYDKIYHAVVNERDWRQRKVLELFLLGRMVDTTSQRTRPIIEKLKTEWELGLRLYAQLSSEKYLAETHIRLQDLQSLLESIDTSLSSILDAMKMWDTRERDRAQQPRWTRNDERKYRESINNLRGSVERKTADLKGLQFDARALKEKYAFTLKTNITKIGENRSTSKEENLRLFTYVTVVFLPLGFAASIFSMAGTPDTPLLVDMITCAIIALILTVIMLLNAQSLAGMARDTSRAIHTYSLKKIEGSQLAKYHKIKHTRSGTSTRKEFLRTEDDEKSWYLIFWIAYVLVEFPARRVFAASRALISLNHGKQDSKVETPETEKSRTESARVEQSNAGVSKNPGNTVASAPPSILGSALRVFGGFVFSPLFVTSWIIQVAICNVLDLLRLIHGIMPSLVSPSSTKMNDETETYPDVWFKPGKWWRPIREMNQRLKHKRDSRVEVAKAEVVKPANEEIPAKSDISEKPEVNGGSNSG